MRIRVRYRLATVAAAKNVRVQPHHAASRHLLTHYIPFHNWEPKVRTLHTLQVLSAGKGRLNRLPDGVLKLSTQVD